MFKSTALNFVVVGFLVLLMSIPLILVSGVVDDRADYSDDTKRNLGFEWGGPQSILGFVLEIPVTEKVERVDTVPILDPVTQEVLLDENGTQRTRQVTSTEIVTRPSIFVLPNDYDQQIDVITEERRRGIFVVPVYRGTAQIDFDFDLNGVGDLLTDAQTAVYEDAELIVGLKNNRSLRGEIVLQAGDNTLNFEPRAGSNGLNTAIGDPRDIASYRTKLEFNGAQTFATTAAGRNNRVTMSSDWPHPSFNGSFLPDNYEVTSTGFTAEWAIPHLARPVPLLSRELTFAALEQTAQFGLDFFEPNDFYQKSYRSARYGILFIGLTFLTILLLDSRSERPVHPIQYIMVGLAQSVFVLLMVSLSEQLGFFLAYLISSVATIGLITLYAFFGMKFGKRSWVILGILTVIYTILYFILASEDFALLAGSILAFIAVAAMMYFTKDEDWSMLGKAINDATKVGDPEAPKEKAE